MVIKKKRAKPFKNGRITFREIRQAVNANKKAGIFRPISKRS